MQTVLTFMDRVVCFRNRPDVSPFRSALRVSGDNNLYLELEWFVFCSGKKKKGSFSEAAGTGGRGTRIRSSIRRNRLFSVRGKQGVGGRGIRSSTRRNRLFSAGGRAGWVTRGVLTPTRRRDITSNRTSEECRDPVSSSPQSQHVSTHARPRTKARTCQGSSTSSGAAALVVSIPTCARGTTETPRQIRGTTTETDGESGAKQPR